MLSFSGLEPDSESLDLLQSSLLVLYILEIEFWFLIAVIYIIAKVHLYINAFFIVELVVTSDFYVELMSSATVVAKADGKVAALLCQFCSSRGAFPSFILTFTLQQSPHRST